MATNNEPNYKEILLTVLAEPDYLRLDYWQKQQRESGYNEMGFYKKIKDALEYYYNLIEDKIIEKESLGIPTNDYKIPLLLETDLKIKGELGRNEIQLLNTELKKYFATCLSFEQKVTYYKVAKYNIPFLWLYDTVFTVCEWVKPISQNIEPVKYIEYFFTEIDFDKIEFNITKGEAKKYFNAIYYGLEQLLKADISKAIQNYQNNISNLTKQQIQETQIQLIELIGNLKRQTRTNEAGISFTHRYNLLYKSIEAKKTFLNIDYQIFIAHFNETISNDLLSSFEIINETFKEIAPLIQDKTTNSQPNKEQKIEAPIIEFKPSKFSELFINPTIVNDCINLLRETDKPCINEDNEYIRNKGAFVVWFNTLEQKKVFNYSYTNDIERAETLNYNFEGLNVSDSLFRQGNKRAKDNYKTYFETEISAIKR